MEVPLTYGRCSRCALDSCYDTERPQVLKHKESSQPPAVSIDEEFLCAYEGTREEDPFEHEHPDPGEEYSDCECAETEYNEIWTRRQDLSTELQNSDGLCKAVTRFDYAEGPEDGHQRRYERQPTHSSILEAFAVVSALETADKRVQCEREEYHWDRDNQSIDKAAYVMPQQG